MDPSDHQARASDLRSQSDDASNQADTLKKQSRDHEVIAMMAGDPFEKAHFFERSREYARQADGAASDAQTYQRQADDAERDATYRQAELEAEANALDHEASDLGAAGDDVTADQISRQADAIRTRAQGGSSFGLF